MNQRQLASVLFTAIGVFIAASHLAVLLILVVQIIPSTHDAEQPVSQHLMFVLSSLLAILAGLILVLLRDRLAHRLFPLATESLGSREVHAVALSVLGSYFVVQGLAHLAGAGHFDWHAATQLALGVGLFFGAGTFSRLWARARSAGASRDAAEGAD